MKPPGKDEKEEFPGFRVEKAAWELLPQICVVSRNKSLG
jgi:hypothetical protein